MSGPRLQTPGSRLRLQRSEVALMAYGLWIELDRRPPGAGAIVAGSIVEPSGLADPELDHVGHETIAGPERRPRDGAAVVLCYELRHANRQRIVALERSALL